MTQSGMMQSGVTQPMELEVVRPATLLQLDRRSMRTRLALRRALAEEIDAVGDLSQVTVTAVTDRAGVTRRTFYSHFKDIPNLVDRVEQDALQELMPYLSALSEVNLEQLKDALDSYKPCPGSAELLGAIRKRGFYLRPLLGKGGDPAFAERLKRTAHEAIAKRALHDLNPRAVGPFFDYYLTFAISAEVGVLVRWLVGGMRESDEQMAGLMTALMFVAPGDLYGKPIKLDIPRFALATLVLGENNNE